MSSCRATNANADPEFVASFASMREAVERLSARVTGVFLTPVDLLGDPQKGRRKTDGTPWSHLHVRMPRNRVYAGTLLNAGQAAAEKAEDVKNVTRALGEFPLALLEQATQLLKSDALYRAERVAGPVEWLRNLSAAVGGKKNARIRENLIWRAVASAPAGFCHPRVDGRHAARRSGSRRAVRVARPGSAQIPLSTSAASHASTGQIAAAAGRAARSRALGASSRASTDRDALEATRRGGDFRRIWTRPKSAPPRRRWRCPRRHHLGDSRRGLLTARRISAPGIRKLLRVRDRASRRSPRPSCVDRGAA